MSNGGTAALTGPAIQVGTPDLVTGNYVVNPFNFFLSIGVDATVLMSDGHGGLVAAAGSPVPVSLIGGQGINVGVSLGDMNGDGKLDMVVADPNGQVAVFLGDGHGGFSAGPGGPGSVTVALNDGHGGFSTTTVPVVQDPFSVALGDLNGDGHLDLVVASAVAAGTVDVLLGDGLGGFTRVPGAPFATGALPFSVAL